MEWKSSKYLCRLKIIIVEACYIDHFVTCCNFTCVSAISLYCPTVDYIKRCILILFYLHFSVGNVQKFPRTRVWDPYRRLGISRDASEEEIWGSRNFLLEQYSGHERSAESIEAAFEKILMDSFQQRKKTKINLKTKLKKKVEESPPWIKNLLNFVELPPTDVIFRRLFLFAFMGGWSIMNSAEGGPAFQVCSIFSVLIFNFYFEWNLIGKRHYFLGQSDIFPSNYVQFY